MAVDLIGMGKSDKPNLDYRFEDHARYLEGFIEALDLRDVTLVLHDWGGALGIEYAMRHPDNVRGIALMEAVAMPLTWDDADWATRYLFRRMRDPDDGKTLIVDDNFFVETLLPAMSGRELSDAEMQAYRAPYLRPEDRRPVRVWPLEIPIDGRPARTYERLGTNYEQLRRSDIPLLLLTADPGVILKRSLVERMQHDLPRLETASIGSALHYVQEAQPHRIGEALRRWMESL